MSYQIIKSGTDTRAVGPHDVVKNIDSLSQVQEKTVENKISKKRIVNHLNFINFQNDAIKVNLKHKRFDRIVTLQAKPHPCTGDKLFGEWVDPTEIKQRLNTYEFENISLDHGNQSLLVQPKLINIDASGISLELSELYYPLCFESNIRQPCSGIKAQLIQNSVVFIGTLTDFCPASFHVNISLTPPQTSQWINSDSNVEVILSDEVETLYSGNCNVIKKYFVYDCIKLLLEPRVDSIYRFKQKKFRSTRDTIHPSPNIFFTHPFLNTKIELKILDLSGSGFSAEDDNISSMLLPGMIIPKVVMTFAKHFKIEFKAQIVYKNNNNKITKYGMVFIDIGPENHNDLMSILHQAKNEYSYFNNEIDLKELWNFFFNSGFIYPEKYNYLQKFNSEIKKTYRTIYSKGVSIAKHFVFQQNGQIRSHMSTIRFYEKSWLIHHHAARKASFNGGGISVLNQIGRFINDSHRLYSTNMNYVFCYFRPSNKFPDRVFGGASRIINNSKACSLDSFAYLHMNNSHKKNIIPISWELGQTTAEDLCELEAFYKLDSDGLMIEALDLIPSHNNLQEISKQFQEIGLTRKRHLYSLKNEGVLKAVIVLNLSDVGLNLSDLTNSISVYIVDSNELSSEILFNSLHFLEDRSSTQNSPILIYPAEFAQIKEISYERIYNLWILNTESTDLYFRYLKRLLRFIQH